MYFFVDISIFNFQFSLLQQEVNVNVFVHASAWPHGSPRYSNISLTW